MMVVMTYLIVSLMGALIGALMRGEEGKLVWGFIPLKIHNAIVGAGLFCFLYWAGQGINPDSY